MKFKFSRASDWQNGIKEEFIEISTLEELREICLKEDCELIVDLRKSESSITVYDDYVE